MLSEIVYPSLGLVPSLYRPSAVRVQTLACAPSTSLSSWPTCSNTSNPESVSLSAWRRMLLFTGWPCALSRGCLVNTHDRAVYIIIRVYLVVNYQFSIAYSRVIVLLSFLKHAIAQFTPVSYNAIWVVGFHGDIWITWNLSFGPVNYTLTVLVLIEFDNNCTFRRVPGFNSLRSLNFNVLFYFHNPPIFRLYFQRFRFYAGYFDESNLLICQVDPWDRPYPILKPDFQFSVSLSQHVNNW